VGRVGAEGREKERIWFVALAGAAAALAVRAAVRAERRAASGRRLLWAPRARPPLRLLARSHQAAAAAASSDSGRPAEQPDQHQLVRPIHLLLGRSYSRD